MSVPIRVTEKTPIIIPRAVSSDLTLFAKTAIKEDRFLNWKNEMVKRLDNKL